MNEKRRGLRCLFHLAASGASDGLRIAFKDRQARFGYAYLIEAFTAAHGGRLEVPEGPIATDATQELVADMLVSVTCFAARRCGSRSQQFHQTVQAAAKEAEALA